MVNMLVKNAAKNLIGYEFYCVYDDDPEVYYWGTMMSSDESGNHKIFTKGHSCNKCYMRDNQENYFPGSDYTLFFYTVEAVDL